MIITYIINRLLNRYIVKALGGLLVIHMDLLWK